MNRVLARLKSKYNPVHIHFNNHGIETIINGEKLWKAIEITYIRKDLCDCDINNIVEFPINEIDYPNK